MKCVLGGMAQVSDGGEEEGPDRQAGRQAGLRWRGRLRETFREQIAQIEDLARGHPSTMASASTCSREHQARFRRGTVICFRTSETMTPCTRSSRAGTRFG